MDKLQLGIFMISILLIMIVSFPVVAYAAHQSNQSTSCSITAIEKIIPVKYNNQTRGNPDNSYYNGDSFHYFVKFNAIAECLSFTIQPVISNGMFDILSHNIIMWNTPIEQNHSHTDMELVPKYLTTYHFSKILDVNQKCVVHRGGLRTCEIASYTLSAPVFSYREDKELSKYESEKISKLNRDSKYKRTETQAWDFTNTDGKHSHSDKLHDNESGESIKSFENYVKSNCNTSTLKKYSGCVYGHVELDIVTVNEKCLFEELDKMNVTYDKEKEKDVCVKVSHDLSINAVGTKLQCNDNKCKTVKVTKNGKIRPPVLSPEFEIILDDSPIKDRDNYDGKNKDGTYFLYDPIGIIHKPSLLWKDERSGTIQFETTKKYDLKNEYESDCNNNTCHNTIGLNTVYPATIKFGNGEGITIYNSTITTDGFGFYDFEYFTIATNLNREISRSENSIKEEIVDYNPKFKSRPYPLISDNKEYAFDDRQGLAMYYFGNVNDDTGEVFEKRRSKINHVWNFGVGFDIFGQPSIFKQNFTLNDGITVSPDVLKSHNQTAMFSESGYGKIYFEYFIKSLVMPEEISRFENVTTYTTLSSVDFASKDTLIDHYTMRYPELPFTSKVIIKSVNQNGTIMYDDKIELEIIPHRKINAEYINNYIYDKIEFDTNDTVFAQIISNDTYPMIQKYTDNGILNATISKISLYFEDYGVQENNSTSVFSDKISDLDKLIEDPENIRLLAPYDIGLSGISPTTVIIKVNNMTDIFDNRYYPFGSMQTVIINTQTDNVLSAYRSLGKIIIDTPENFGNIHAVLINGEILKQDCRNGCVLMFQPNYEIKLSVLNKWGGVASVVLPEIEKIPIPISDEPNYIIIGLVVLGAISGYILYKKFKLI